MRNKVGAALIVFGIALSTAAGAQQKLGPGNPSCYAIKNTIPFTILTHVMLPSRAFSVARIGPNEIQVHCIAGELFPEGRVNFRVVSGMGPPLFSCQTKIDKPIVVSGTQDKNGGWTYSATCK